MPEGREHVVTPAEAGRRIDQVLAACWCDLSRSRLQKLIAAGLVRAAGRPVRARDRAVAGMRLGVALPDAEPSLLRPEAIPLAIVYEDEHLLVVDKPPGLVVHPGAGVRTGTLVHALLHHAPQIAAVGGAGRPGIVHRLDKDTSGLLIVAKTEACYLQLVAAIARREVARTYQALVWGVPRTSGGRVEAPVGRHPGDRQRMAVTARGKPAATRYRVLEPFGWASYLECALESGRTHQIRVHLSHIGHPVLADPVYGGGRRRALNVAQGVRRLADAILAVLPRQALHAARLEFDHPVTASRLRLEAPLPADFAAALRLLRRPADGGAPAPPAHPRALTAAIRVDRRSPDGGFSSGAPRGHHP
jgi:23S rRNA pseudouridine1911/1915/1917 synthase